MRENSSSIEDLLEFIKRFVGDYGVRVFKVLMESNKELLDTEITKLTRLGEQEVRRVLYELHNLGLVTYRKSRNPDDSRYIYHWKIDEVRINQVLLQRKKAVLKKLRERLEYEESNTFYICPVDGVRLSFEEALENDFKCPRCGSMLVYEDNDGVRRALRELVRRLEEEIRNEERAITR